MATGRLAQQTQQAINDIKNPNARAAAQAEFNRATAGGSPISQNELARIQNAAAAASPTGGGPAVQALGQITHPQASGGGGGGGQQPPPQQQVQQQAADPRIGQILAQQQAERVSAFAILEDTFRSWGLPELVPTIKGFLQQNLSPGEATLKLKETDVWKERFKGNEGRLAKGLAIYQPDEYLRAEETYSNILRANNLSGLANRDTFTKLITGAVSAVEVQDRINLVFNKIDTAGEDVKSELGRYFSQFNINDPGYQRLQLAEALLSGEDTAKVLEMNVRKAQLRAGATAARYDLEEERVAALERLLNEAGVSNAYAAGQAGFQALSRIQPQAEILSQRYQMDQVGETELEKEAFLGLESEKRKRLVEQEKATFAGGAGTTQVSLAQSVAGQL
jgi:hypothetical protein